MCWIRAHVLPALGNKSTQTKSLFFPRSGSIFQDFRQFQIPYFASDVYENLNVKQPEGAHFSRSEPRHCRALRATFTQHLNKPQYAGVERGRVLAGTRCLSSSNGKCVSNPHRHILVLHRLPFRHVSSAEKGREHNINAKSQRWDPELVRSARLKVSAPASRPIYQPTS